MPTLPIALLVASGLADLAFVLVRAASARRALGPERPFGIGALTCIGAAFVPFCIVKAGVLVMIGGSFFFGVSVAYVTVFVVAPVLGAVALVRGSRATLARSVRCLAAASIALPCFGIYATFVEPVRLVAERVEIPVPAARLAEPLRIAVLADIQSTRIEPQLVEAIERAMAFAPHLILLPGDLIQAGPEEYARVAPAFRELLRPLAAPLGVFFVLGNTDDPKRVLGVLDGTNVRVLRNQTVELEHAGGNLRIGGADFYPHAPHVRKFARDLEALPGDDLRILLAHYPDVALALAPNTRVDLVIAGHTHGGQVQVPFFGPPVTLSAVPRYVAAGGLTEMDGRRIYVSRGLGSERGLAPRIRFLAPPELSLLTLVPERTAE